MSPRHALLALGLLALVACGSGDAPADASPDSVLDSSVDADATTAPPRTVGGDRPARILVPPGYDPDIPTPLVVALHPFTGNPIVIDAYLALTRHSRELGFLVVLPAGRSDSMGRGYWNATDACCAWEGETPDDVGYLLGVLDEVEAHYNVAPGRVFAVGHSNGGFMAHRLACEAPDRFAAIASIAGVGFAVSGDCAATTPVSVLQIHGDADATVRYEGGADLGSLFSAPMTTPTYPGAVATVQHWASLAGCVLRATAGDPLDLEVDLEGAETQTSRYETDCAAGVGVELWTIRGGEHVPVLQPDFFARVFSWLDTYRR